MEDCCDPLLATDASSRRESFCEIYDLILLKFCFCFQSSLLTFFFFFFSLAAEKAIESSSTAMTMVDLDSNCELSNGKSL